MVSGRSAPCSSSGIGAFPRLLALSPESGFGSGSGRDGRWVRVGDGFGFGESREDLGSWGEVMLVV